MSSSIVIPENAPFNAEQRAWLSEFLTKVLGGAEVEVETVAEHLGARVGEQVLGHEDDEHVLGRAAPREVLVINRRFFSVGSLLLS